MIAGQHLAICHLPSRREFARILGDVSKAFTRESDDAPERPAPARPMAALPPGAKNLLTPDGAVRLREELDRLMKEQRPALAAEAQIPDTKRQLGALDHRIAHLEQCLHTATVVPPPDPPWDHVRFGAHVTIRERDGREDNFRIVGVEEADPAEDRISCLSPIATALLHARLGQRLRIRIPAGEREVEIVAIRYERPPNP